jgi:hypothetical protein
MNNRDIRLAHPVLQEAFAYLVEQWPLEHPDDPVPFLSQVFRPKEMQDAYYAQGRKSLKEVNDLRKLAGLAAISAQENKRTVTNAPSGKSKHEKKPSQAFDIAFVKKGTKTVLDWTPRLFNQAAVIIKKKFPNVTWGGDWKRFPDRPHFEI